jgi:hypothetical protein
MKESEKSRNDLIACLERHSGSVGECFSRALNHIPTAMCEEIATLFREKWDTDQNAAREWAGSLATILGGDYDGSPLSIEEWQELRDLVSENAGELDMDILSHVMSLVMEYGALS